MKPKVRFKGFSGEWKEIRLGEIGDICMCKRVMKNETNTSGPIPFYKIGTFGNEADAFIPEELFLEYKKKYSYPRKGEVLFSAAGTIGRSVVFDGEPAYFQDSNIVWITNSEKIVSNFFLKCAYSIISWNIEDGGIVKRLYNDNIRKTSILIPTHPEQTTIATFFTHLDTLISSTSRRLDKLRAVKAAALQTLFPQEGEKEPRVRFKGFSGEWKETSFRDITVKTTEKNKDDLPLESFSISNTSGFIPQNQQFENGGTMADADKRMYYIVSPYTFAYNPARINVGSIGYYEGANDVIVSSLYEVFKTTNGINDKFLMLWFKSPTFHKMIDLYQEGGVRLYFFFDKLLKCSIDIPSLPEQTAIANYFTHLDDLIQSTTRRLDKLRAVKAACLEGMFV